MMTIGRDHGRRLAIGLSMATAMALGAPAAAQEPGWGYYGGDAGGQRYSPARQVNLANVTRLAEAWRFSTGDLATKGLAVRHASFENTPILAGGRLYVCSPFNEVSALDPGTGRPYWRFDPRIDPSVRHPNDDVCRGVAYWRNPQAPARAPCAERLFMNTNDRRLFALDAATGRPCAGFGRNGAVDAIPETRGQPSDAQITSPPVVVAGVVITGSSLDDNQRVRETSGAVHAFDAVTGAPRWRFDPLAGTGKDVVAGAANVWAPMSVDEARGLVFLPTTSPSPDFYGAMRPGNDGHADSVVALHVADGALAWAFQVTHHDVWDYDLPAQPTLASLTYRGQTTAAVLQTTKQGLLFTLARDTGAPVIPVAERKVPQGGAPGEVLSPTQPFPLAPRPLAPSKITPDDAFGLTSWDRDACRKAIAGGRNDGLYTPPSTRGTIIYPFTGGGSNWGGLAFDPGHDVVFVNTSSALHKVTLFPADQFAAMKAAHPNAEVSPNRGARYGMMRELVRSPLGLPCNPPPWGLLHAIDMHDGHVLWEVPLGTTADLAPGSQYLLHGVGTPNFGGPIVTAGGLVFIGATLDDYLRAYDARTGRELWRGRLPAGGQATPMTYVWKGRQYVVIASGGHSKSNTKRGDEVIAFALPR
jgi:quinoprotein glucose dehydrogenase